MEPQKPNDPNSTNNDEENDRYSRRRHRRERGGSTVFGGLFLILLGVLLYLAFEGIIPWAVWWKYLIIGLGAIFLIDAVLSLGDTERRRFVIGRVIAGMVLVGVGLAFIAGFTTFWPLVLVAVGIIILIFGLMRRRPPQ